MKRILQAILVQRHTVLESKPVLFKLLLLVIPVLLLCLLFGWLLYLLLAIGYFQLVWSAFHPHELVEVRPVQRAAVCACGLIRMLFFTGLIIDAVWPFYAMAACQVLCLVIMVTGERMGVEMSPLPLMIGIGYLALGIFLGSPLPYVQLWLCLALIMTLLRLLAQQEKIALQLTMRFHLA